MHKRKKIRVLKILSTLFFLTFLWPVFCVISNRPQEMINMINWIEKNTPEVKLNWSKWCTYWNLMIIWIFPASLITWAVQKQIDTSLPEILLFSIDFWFNLWELIFQLCSQSMQNCYLTHTQTHIKLFFRESFSEIYFAHCILFKFNSYVAAFVSIFIKGGQRIWNPNFALTFLGKCLKFWDCDLGEMLTCCGQRLWERQQPMWQHHLREDQPKALGRYFCSLAS